MGFFDEIKKLTQPYDDIEDDFDDDMDLDAPSPVSAPRDNPFSAGYSAEAAPAGAARGAKRSGKVVSLGNAQGAGKVVLLKPERFDIGKDIADHLRSLHTVVINTEDTPKDTSRRLIDFLCGAAYALDGQVKKITNTTFIITPSNVDLTGDMMDELETSGFSF